MSFVFRGMVKKHQWIHAEIILLLTVWEELYTAEFSQNAPVHSHRGDAVLLLTVWEEFFTSVYSQNTPADTGENSYCCSEFGKRFSQPSNIKQHQHIHTGEKLHYCSQCEQFSGDDAIFKSALVKSQIPAHSVAKVYTTEWTQETSAHSYRREATTVLSVWKTITNGSNLKILEYSHRDHVTVYSVRSSLKDFLESHELIHTGKKPHYCS